MYLNKAKGNEIHLSGLGNHIGAAGQLEVCAMNMGGRRGDQRQGLLNASRCQP